MARVAVLGAGRMGGAIAKRLTGSGHTVVLWDRHRSKAESLKIGEVASTPPEAASQADLVISIVTNAQAVEAIYRGQDGTPGALDAGRGRLFANSSTSGPWLLPGLEASASAAGAQLVDAPILGSPGQVESGAATVLLGGERGPVERAGEIMGALGTVQVVGALGSASQLKLISNSMFGAIIAMAGELLEAGETIGLDREVLFTTLAHYAPALNARRAEFMEGRLDPPQFTPADLVKDLDMALQQAHQADVALPITALTRELFGQLKRTSPGLDIAAIRPRRAA